ncbi:prepilin-type N-terminal cleavage/methylation domain-containing protein [Candidatus Sumerlaeota bacterium]|nr:prepilin-type N-terminal cleavage/methylation domain-containing protein [Candidatus Sumerlaeota bacterium]
MRNSGFTLIELLVVVGIIAILSAIAIPNFLEAQTRSKVSRAKTDLRSLAGALETYHVDNRNYPPARSFCEGFMESIGDYFMCPIEITTPVAYISNRPPDIFNLKYRYKYISPGFGYSNGSPTILAIWVPKNFPEGFSPSEDIPYFDYGSSPVKWALWSVGPKGDVGFWNAGTEHHPVPSRAWYDPTNGTVSNGIVVRLSTGHGSP